MQVTRPQVKGGAKSLIQKQIWFRTAASENVTERDSCRLLFSAPEQSSAGERAD
jgi:hypothetical protein